MTIETLKTELWKKVIGNATIARRNHYYEEIQGAIYNETGYTLSRDTIRNFIEGRNQPSPRTLDIYATFILGGTQEEPKTFQDFREWWEEVQNVEKVEDQKMEPRNERIPFKRILLLGTICAIFFSLFWCGRKQFGHQYTAQHDFYFRDTFLIEDVNTLLDNDWQILDPDQQYLDTLAVVRHEEDYLHLYTLEGDYWDVWGGESDRLKIKNMFVHPVECKCCVITTKIDSFYPSEAHQQAGIFLFDDLDKENFIRITYKYRVKETDCPYTPWIQVVQMKNKKMTDLGGEAHFHRVRLDTQKLHKSIGLKLEVTDQRIVISYNYDNKAFLPCFEMTPFFDINYIGLGAFQGYDLNATILPVRYDFVEVIGCDVEF
jgi:hypothetical protein